MIAVATRHVLPVKPCATCTRPRDGTLGCIHDCPDFGQYCRDCSSYCHGLLGHRGRQARHVGFVARLDMQGQWPDETSMLVYRVHSENVEEQLALLREEADRLREHPGNAILVEPREITDLSSHVRWHLEETLFRAYYGTWVALSGGPARKEGYWR